MLLRINKTDYLIIIQALERYNPKDAEVIEIKRKLLKNQFARFV